MASTPTWLGSYNRVTRRRLLKTSAAGLGAAAILACGGDSDGGGGLKFDDAGNSRKPGTVWNAANDWKLEDETKDAVKGGTYRGVLDADQAGSYDALILAPSQVPFSDHVHEYLMGKNRGPGVDPSGRDAEVPVPVLAQSMELAGDGSSVTFTIRPNVKWHPTAPVNGRTMDMDDWRTTLERFLATSAQREPLMGVLDKAEYPDATHMVLKLKFPYAPFMQRIYSERFAFQVFPKELNADPNLAASTSVGTGYKILDKHQPSVTMDYRKHAAYWGGEPFIDRWTFPIVPEYANRYAQFVSGNIVDWSPNARDILRLQKDAPGTVVVAKPIPDDDFSRVIFGREQADTQPWKDPRVRIAVRRSTDFKSIGEFLSNKQQFEAAGVPVEVVTRTHVIRGPSFFLDPEKGELGELSKNYIFDIAEAKKLTAAAGFANVIDINFRVLPGGGGQVPEDNALTIDSLNKSGVFRVTAQTSTNTVDHRNCRSLRQCNGLVQSSLNDDLEYVMREYHSQGPRPGGEPAYGSPAIDRIADAFRREMDPQKRIALIHELQREAAQFFPTVPFVHQYTEFDIRWPWLHNAQHGDTSVQGMSGRPVWGGHRQWLSSDMPRRNG
jgi:ABC-type transport system substrate-binding protein